MADIAMCGGDGCPLRNACWRYLATPSLPQTWIAPPYSAERLDCDYWLQVPWDRSEELEE